MTTYIVKTTDGMKHKIVADSFHLNFYNFLEFKLNWTSEYSQVIALFPQHSISWMKTKNAGKCA